MKVTGHPPAIEGLSRSLKRMAKGMAIAEISSKLGVPTVIFLSLKKAV